MNTRNNEQTEARDNEKAKAYAWLMAYLETKPTQNKIDIAKYMAGDVIADGYNSIKGINIVMKTTPSQLGLTTSMFRTELKQFVKEGWVIEKAVPGYANHYSLNGDMVPEIEI